MGKRSFDTQSISLASSSLVRRAARGLRGLREVMVATVLASVVTCLFLLCATTHAQQRRVVVTLQSGLKHEGAIFNVEQISVDTGGGGNDKIKPVVVINDGLRRIFVNQYSILPNIVDSTRQETEIDIWQRVYEGPRKGAAAFLYATPFNENGHRILTVRTANGNAQYVQGITKLNPRYVEVKALSNGTRLAPHDWKMSLAIGTVPTSVIKGVLENEIVDPNQLTAWLQIPDFLYQAGRYTDAKDELLRIASKFPDQKERIEAKRLIVLQEEAKQQLREILLTIDAGQTQLAKRWINAIDRSGIAIETAAELDDLLDQIEKQQQQRDTILSASVAAVESLQQSPDGELTDEQIEALTRFKDEVTSDLNLHNVKRLASFERLSSSKENSAKQNIALAISGWILGSNNATDNWALAQSLFSVRDLVVQYLDANTPDERQRILTQLEQFESSAVNYLAPLLAQLVPLKHDLIDDYTGKEPIEFSVTLPGTIADPAARVYRCLAHLPTEYDPYRRYPLLLSLPGSASVENQLNHWCGRFSDSLGVRYGNASRNGTIVVTVDWKAPGQRKPEYSTREHLVVMKALRESMRRFAVDSDRVFLQGHGVGGDVAYDVGLAHPEHWAGIITVSATGIQKYPLIYADNQGNRLPIYAVVGQRNIGATRGCQDAWNTWLKSKNRNECTVIQYQGRLDEQFLEDVPEMFKWMRAQRRRYPDSAGFEFSCKSIRPSDNYFWFLELHGFPEKNIKWPELFRARKDVNVLKIEGKLRDPLPSPNIFVIGVKAGDGLSLWLRPDYFDFSRKIEINGRGRAYSGSVIPSRQVILEDARTRSDFQRPYWARLDYFDGRWQSN